MTAVDLRGVRLQDGDLQSAVQRYERNGRTILLVSTVHLAEPGHFQDLRAIVDEAIAHGCTVHHEKVRMAEQSPRTDAERAALESSSKKLDVQLRDAPKVFGLNWVYQEDSAMASEPTWHNIDISSLDLVRVFGPGGSAMITPDADAMQQYLEAEPGSAKWEEGRTMFVTSYLHSNANQPPVTANGADGEPGQKSAGPPEWAVQVMFSYREFVAGLAALDTDNDLVLVWHGAHFPGIGGMLLRNAFTLTEVRWLTAIHGKNVRTRSANG